MQGEFEVYTGWEETGPRIPLFARVSEEAIRVRLARMAERGVLISPADIDTTQAQARDEALARGAVLLEDLRSRGVIPRL